MIPGPGPWAGRATALLHLDFGVEGGKNRQEEAARGARGATIWIGRESRLQGAINPRLSPAYVV